MRNDIVENVVETVVVPDVPKVLPDQEIYVYVPVATENDKGILSAGGPDFAIVDGKLKLLDGPNSKLYGINAFINLVNEKVKRLEDAGYITKDVDNLVNYYLKSETYTRDEVNAAIQRMQKAAFKIVNELPEVGDFNLVYLLPKEDSDTVDLYDEYVYIDGKWERIGSTAINLDDYYTKTEVNSEITEATKYTNSTPTPSAIGGIQKGETFTDVPINNMLTKILYPYVALKITSASTTPNGGVSEKGTIVTIERAQVTVQKGSAAIVKAELLDGSNVLSTKTSTDFDSSTITFLFTPVSVSTNKTFTIRVTDAEKKSYSANTGSFSFVYPYYYGVADSDDVINGSFIKSNLTKLTQGRGTKTVYYTANNQKMVFASPYAVSKITDPNGFDVTSTFTMTRVSVTGLDNTDQSYYVYTANEASTVSNFKMTFTN